MTPQAVKAALEGLLATLLPNTPTDWANTDFSMPSVDYISPDGVSWCRPAFRPGKSYECEVGRDGLSKRTGAFIVQLFFPKFQGAGLAMEASYTLESAYRRQDLAGVECGEPYTNDVGEMAGETRMDGGTESLKLGNWYQVNVIVPWWAWIGE